MFPKRTARWLPVTVLVPSKKRIPDLAWSSPIQALVSDTWEKDLSTTRKLWMILSVKLTWWCRSPITPSRIQLKEVLFVGATPAFMSYVNVLLMARTSRTNIVWQHLLVLRYEINKTASSQECLYTSISRRVKRGFQIDEERKVAWL